MRGIYSVNITWRAKTRSYLRKRSQRLEPARHGGSEAPLPANARQEQLVRRGRALVGPVGSPQLLHCLVGTPRQLRVGHTWGSRNQASGRKTNGGRGGGGHCAAADDMDDISGGGGGGL